MDIILFWVLAAVLFAAFSRRACDAQDPGQPQRSLAQSPASPLDAPLDRDRQPPWRMMWAARALRIRTRAFEDKAMPEDRGAPARGLALARPNGPTSQNRYV